MLLTILSLHTKTFASHRSHQTAPDNLLVDLTEIPMQLSTLDIETLELLQALRKFLVVCIGTTLRDWSLLSLIRLVDIKGLYFEADKVHPQKPLPSPCRRYHPLQP